MRPIFMRDVVHSDDQYRRAGGPAHCVNATEMMPADCRAIASRL
jgi:hypothetical protein